MTDYIFAGNYQQAVRFCQEELGKSKNDRTVVIITDAERLYGRRWQGGDKVHFVGTWADRGAKSVEVIDILHMQGYPRDGRIEYHD